LIPYIKNEKIL